MDCRFLLILLNYRNTYHLSESPIFYYLNTNQSVPFLIIQMEQSQKPPSTTPQKALVFTLTFICYVGLHSIRTTWSYSKTQISSSTQFPNTFFGLCDAVFLLSYSLGLTTLSSLMNRVRINWFLGAGMILSSLAFCWIAVSYLIFQNLSQAVVLGSMVLNGFFQGVGWPGMMTVMANWFGKGRRGVLFALWSINASVGNIVGLVGCSVIEGRMGQPWTTNFFFVAGLTVLFAVFIIIFLKPRSKDGVNQNENQNLITETYRKREIVDNVEPQSQQQAKPSINILTAFLVPRVPYYVVSYSMIKSCINGLLFWLPTYLASKNLSDFKASISSMSDIGTFIGGVAVGYLGDRYHKRALFLSPLLFTGSILMLIVWKVLADIALPYYFLIFGIGFLIGGPYRIIGSAITIDLGQHESLKGQEKAVSVISGLIEGCAAIMSSVTLFMIPLVSLNWLFLIFFVEGCIAAGMLAPLLWKDWRKVKKEREEVKEMKETKEMELNEEK